ncbi:proheparin-binding EGF-like growth factor isoform X6 [Halichoerus grypus]|nr:proheparin-binding EGF-like growth factor isoform X5 [Halichoerus grypus]XP_035979914.1 proheparin-binding EGF-like growth factor isoform X5 [Halichoerus grypus]
MRPSVEKTAQCLVHSEEASVTLQKVTWVQIPGVEQGWLEGPGLEQGKERGVSKGRAQLSSRKAAARQAFGERSQLGLAPRGRQQTESGRISCAPPAPASVPAPGGRRLRSDCCLAASAGSRTMKLLPSVVLKLFLAAALSALVTGDSLERLRRGLAAGTGNLDSPTESTDQLLAPEGGRGREVLNLEETDLDLLRAAFSSKPQALATPGKEERGKKKKKGKGLGRKRDPCLRKYKDFCIHGECKYVKELRAPSCICEPGYHGERCHGLSLPVENRLYTYDHTTILAVVAVVLSSVCLLVIAGLLMFRYHRRGGYDVESEEKVKLGMTTSH